MQGFGWVPTATDPWVLPGGVAGGTFCTWDLTSPPADADSHYSYGWAPLSEQDQATVIAALENEGGWVREEEAGTVFYVIPEGPNTDANGYSSTYVFSDGTVRYSITKADAQTVVTPS